MVYWWDGFCSVKASSMPEFQACAVMAPVDASVKVTVSGMNRRSVLRRTRQPWRLADGDISGLVAVFDLPGTVTVRVTV